MLCEPGGICLVTDIFNNRDDCLGTINMHGFSWGENDFPILQLVHPTLGVIEEPSEYFHPYPIHKRKPDVVPEGC